MAWTNQETLTVAGDTIVRQLGSGTDYGHRITINGTPGTAVPVSKIARNGDWRAKQPEFDLTTTVTPTLYMESQSPAFPGGPITVTCTAAGIGFNSSIAFCTGNADLNSWVITNLGGGNSSASIIDSGGVLTDDSLAADIKAQIDALSWSGVTVARLNNVLTITSTSGIAGNSTEANIVIS